MGKIRSFAFWAVVPLLFSGCASVPQGSVPVPPIPKVVQSGYILGPEDALDIVVWKNESLSHVALIRPDGKITLPLIGDVQAAGLTPTQLAGEIKTRLKEFYKEQPDVFVIVTATNSFSFPVYIMGEVEAPGKHILRGETTLLQALSLARGFKEYADFNNILLLRKEDAVETRMHIRYDDVISGQHPEMNLPLKSGDTIIVP